MSNQPQRVLPGTGRARGRPPSQSTAQPGAGPQAGAPPAGAQPAGAWGPGASGGPPSQAGSFPPGAGGIPSGPRPPTQQPGGRGRAGRGSQSQVQPLQVIDSPLLYIQLVFLPGLRPGSLKNFADLMRTYPIAFECDARNLTRNSVPRQCFRNAPISIFSLTQRHAKNDYVYFDVSIRTLNRSVRSLKYSYFYPVYVRGARRILQISRGLIL